MRTYIQGGRPWWWLSLVFQDGQNPDGGSFDQLHPQNTTQGPIFDCTPTLGEASADLYHKGPSNDKEVLFDSTPDEPMAGQNNSGSYSLDVKNDSIISSNIIFRGSVLRQIEEKRKPRKYIYIGSMHVDVTWISIALEKYLGKSGNFHIYKQLQAWCREMRDLHLATFLYY